MCKASLNLELRRFESKSADESKFGVELNVGGLEELVKPRKSLFSASELDRFKSLLDEWFR